MLLTVFWSALYYEICLLLRDGWDIICHTRIPFPYGIINGFVRTFWLNEYPSISLPSLITWQNWCIVGFRRKVEHRTSSMTFSEKGEVGSRRVGSSPSPLPPWMPYGSATAFSWTTAHIYLPDQTTGWFCFTHKFNVKAYLVPSVQHSATCLPAVADLRGARGTPPGVQIISISCSFWQNLTKSYVGAWRVGTSTSRKSWIRHCSGNCK